MRKALLNGLALAIALAAPASAGAAEPTGNATLVLSPAKVRVLDKRGVAVGGIRGAETEGRETRLQISGGGISGGGADLALDGGLRFAGQEGKARRVVRLSALRVRLGPDPTLSAKVNGGKLRRVFELRAPSGALALDESKGTAQLRGARLVWSSRAKLALQRRLGARLPRGGLGTLTVSAAVNLAEAPKSSLVSGDEPPLLARPAGAVDVTAGSLTWHVRDSWIRYVNSEAAPTALEGAGAQAPIPGDSHPCPDRPANPNPTLTYSYAFPFSSGWYDPASGTAALYYLGGIRFSYPSRGIDLTTRNPEIEINGAASRAIFRLRGEGATAYPDKRAALLSLAPPAPPGESPPSTFTYPAPIRGALTDDGQAVFAGFYPPPGNGFGCFSVSFATG